VHFRRRRRALGGGGKRGQKVLLGWGQEASSSRGGKALTARVAGAGATRGLLVPLFELRLTKKGVMSKRKRRGGTTIKPLQARPKQTTYAKGAGDPETRCLSKKTLKEDETVQKPRSIDGREGIKLTRVQLS